MILPGTLGINAFPLASFPVGTYPNLTWQIIPGAIAIIIGHIDLYGQNAGKVITDDGSQILTTVLQGSTINSSIALLGRV